MKAKLIFLILIISSSIKGISQTSYTGFLDKYPITLILDYSTSGLYVYNKYDTPIAIKGELKNNTLTLNEYDNNKITASLIFNNYEEDANTLKGKWVNTDTSKIFEINLKKDFEVKEGNDITWNSNIELLQQESTKTHYFKTILSKTDDDYYPMVTGLKIFEKKTDKLAQTFKLECEALAGIYSVSINDYNFDNINDFSVFEYSAAGPNTTRLYYLYDIKINRYFESSFSGVSLDFDKDKKRVFERNSCCAGSIVTTAEYKIENNDLILIKEHCYKWDEEKAELVERPIEDCL